MNLIDKPMKNNELCLPTVYIYSKHIKLVYMYTHMIFCASERTFIYPEADS